MVLPFLLWKKYFAAEINRQAEFLITGFAEGLTMIIGAMAQVTDNRKTVAIELIDSERIKAMHLMTQREIIRWNKRFDSTKQQSIIRTKILLKEALATDPNFEEKFVHYKSFLRKLSHSSQFYYSYLARRFAMEALLVVGSFLLFRFYVEDSESEFNCMLNWIGSYKSNAPVPLVLCNIQGKVKIERSLRYK